MMTQGGVIAQRNRLKLILAKDDLSDAVREEAQKRLDALNALTVEEFKKLPVNRRDARARFKKYASRNLRKAAQR